MKRTIQSICLACLVLLLLVSCGEGGDNDSADGDTDVDKDKDHIYIPPDGDRDSEVSDSETDAVESDVEAADSDGDIDFDGIEYFENIPENEEEIYECDPYTAVDTCMTVNYDNDTRRYCEPPGSWSEESCAPGACVTDGASAWCVGKEDSSDGDDDGSELEEADDDSPLLVTHQCTPELTLEGLPCEDDYACPDICGFTIFCYTCSVDGICSQTSAGQGSCAEPSDGDEELDAVELEPEPEPEPELEPEASEIECDFSSLWYCVENILHYCSMNKWEEADCTPGTCVDPEDGNAYCQ